MAPLRYAAKFDPFLSLDCASHALHPGAIQGKEGMKFSHLATLHKRQSVGVVLFFICMYFALRWLAGCVRDLVSCVTIRIAGGFADCLTDRLAR